MKTGMKKNVLKVTKFALMILGVSMLNFAFASGGGTFDEALKQIENIMKLVGGAVAAMGAFNLFDGFSNDNPASKSSGMKQVVAGGGIYVIATTLINTIKF